MRWCCTASKHASHWEWKSSGGTGSSVTQNTTTALYPQDSCLRDFPLPPGGFSLHSENRIYGPIHVRKDDKQLATVSAPRWGFHILISSSPCSSLESKHQTSPKGAPMPRNRALDPTGCKHPRWCRNALHGSQEPDSISLLMSSRPLQHSFTEIGRNACRQRSCTPGVKILIWLSEASLTAGLETSGTQGRQLITKPEAPHNPSGLNNPAKLPCQFRNYLPSAHCCDSSGLQQPGKQLRQPASARGCSAATVLLQHPQKVPVTQREEGSAPQTMGHTDHPPPGSTRCHSLVPSLIRHPHNPPQLNSQRLRWGFNPNSTDCDYIHSLQFQSWPTTSTHTPAWSFPQAVPTPPKPLVPTQLMRVPGSQRHRSSLLTGTLVASSKLMERTCQDSNLLLGVSLLFTSPCGSTLRLYPHTHTLV